MDEIERKKYNKYKFTINFLFLFSFILFMVVVFWYAYFTCVILKNCSMRDLYLYSFIAFFFFGFLFIVRIKRDSISYYFATLRKKSKAIVDKAKEPNETEIFNNRFAELQRLYSIKNSLSREELHEKLHFAFKDFLASYFKQKKACTSDEILLMIKTSTLSGEMKNSISLFIRNLRDDFYANKIHTKERLYSELNNALQVAAKLREKFK